MIYLSQHEIDQIILEDTPLHDETSRALGLSQQRGIIEIRAREAGIVCGLRIAEKMAASLNLSFETALEDGDAISAGLQILSAQGSAQNLHIFWKQALNVIEYLSGVAGYTQRMVAQAREIQPNIQVATTRKALPSARKLLQYAVLCGGGIIHRTGLSETLLVFEQHRAFFPELSLQDFVQRLRQHSPEKRVMLEAETAQQAIEAAQAGADQLQLDKFSADQLRELVPQLKLHLPGLVVAATGSVKLETAAAYAKTGVDILITSSPYHAKPADFGAKITALSTR